MFSFLQKHTSNRKNRFGNITRSCGSVKIKQNRKRKDARTANEDKRAEKTVQLSAGRQTAVEADKEEIKRYGAIRKVEQIMKKIIFEEMGGTYIRQGDYFIPCLTLPEEEESIFIGVWGQRHL